MGKTLWPHQSQICSKHHTSHSILFTHIDAHPIWSSTNTSWFPFIPKYILLLKNIITTDNRGQDLWQTLHQSVCIGWLRWDSAKNLVCDCTLQSCHLWQMSESVLVQSSQSLCYHPLKCCRSSCSTVLVRIVFFNSEWIVGQLELFYRHGLSQLGAWTQAQRKDCTSKKKVLVWLENSTY